jgi:hypothetical protein
MLVAVAVAVDLAEMVGVVAVAVLAKTRADPEVVALREHRQQPDPADRGERHQPEPVAQAALTEVQVLLEAVVLDLAVVHPEARLAAV